MGETYILTLHEANTIKIMDYIGDKLKTSSYCKNGWLKIQLPVQLLKRHLIYDLSRHNSKYNVMTPKYDPVINSYTNIIKANYEPECKKMMVKQYLSKTEQDGSYMVGMELDELEFFEMPNKVKT